MRRHSVENPFGTLKAWMRSTHFLTKTFPKVRPEKAIARQALFALVGRVRIELRPADYQRGLVDSDI